LKLDFFIFSNTIYVDEYKLYTKKEIYANKNMTKRDIFFSLDD